MVNDISLDWINWELTGTKMKTQIQITLNSV